MNIRYPIYEGVYRILTMENGQVAVYDLFFFFIVSINGLLLIHFCKWRNGQVAVYDLFFFFIVSINGLLLIYFCRLII